MKRVIRYIVAVLMTFVPPRYREDVPLRGEAIVAGIVRILAAASILVYRFMIFSWQRAAIIGPGVDVPSNMPEVNATFGAGIFMMADFVFQPVNMLLIYLIHEGVIRSLAALVGHQVLGTLPLYLISGVHGLMDKAAYKRDLGPLVVDEVVRGGPKSGYDLKVYSCRPKLNWNPYMTIEFEGEFFQMFKEEPGQTSRRFVYYLRRNPAGRVVVVIDHYNVESVLEKPTDKWAGSPTLWDKMFPNWNRGPLVADEIVRGGTARQDYDLKVYSCRPKRDWNTYVTIEFEDQWYQLVREEKGPKPRPFIYYLRKCAETRPAVVIRRYRTDDVLKTPADSNSSHRLR